MQVSPLGWLHFAPEDVPGFFVGLFWVDVTFR